MKKSIYLFALLLLVALVLSLASCALPQGSSEAPDSDAPADSSSVDGSLTDTPSEKDGLVSDGYGILSDDREVEL